MELCARSLFYVHAIGGGGRGLIRNAAHRSGAHANRAHRFHAPAVRERPRSRFAVSMISPAVSGLSIPRVGHPRLREPRKPGPRHAGGCSDLRPAVASGNLLDSVIWKDCPVFSSGTGVFFPSLDVTVFSAGRPRPFDPGKPTPKLRSPDRLVQSGALRAALPAFLNPGPAQTQICPWARRTASTGLRVVEIRGRPGLS
jgi:hypothetical protein